MTAKHYPDFRFSIRLVVDGQISFPTGWSEQEPEAAERMLARAEEMWPGCVSLYDKNRCRE